jgi:hypothetical protein
LPVVRGRGLGRWRTGPTGLCSPPAAAGAETKARRLRTLNAKQLRLGIEQSERDAAKAARVAKLKRQQDRVVRRLQGFIVIFDSSSSNRSDGSDVDPPPTADSYSSAGDRKGKGPVRKW